MGRCAASSIVIVALAALCVVAMGNAGAQTASADAKSAPYSPPRTPWGHPDLQGIYEYACHEGNHAMRNMLSAQRAQERASEQGR